MVRVEFRILGRPEIRVEGERLDLGAPKQQAVLAALLTAANEVVSGDRLTELVWWCPPAAAQANLRVYLSGLRRLLRIPGEPESRIQTVRGGHRIRVLAGELDLDLFEELAREGEHSARGGRPLVAADRLERARRLWRGPAVDGVTFGPALRVRLTRLEERRLAVTEQWAQVRLDLGQHERLIAELSGLVVEHPLRERLWAHLMTALYRSGRQGEALAAYARARTVLAEELGTEPGPELRRLHGRLLREELPPPPAGAVPVGEPATAAGPSGGDPSPGRREPEPPGLPPRQLPGRPSAFRGRTGELARLGRLLAGADGRGGPVVVAIDGPAGVGKSALALTAAHRAAGAFPDGQLYVNLQGATAGLEPLRPVEVLGRFLRALGVRPGTVPGDEAEAAALFRSLVATRRILLILDDTAALAQLRPLLPGGPGCATLITGRSALSGLLEATCLRLGLLSPAEAIAVLEAVAGPDRITADPAAANRLATLCGHLPLALRIAGARLAARPDWPIGGLADRLAAARHRLDELSVADVAVRSSIDLTYRGLAVEHRRALRMLGSLRARDFAPWALATLLDAPLAHADRLLDDLFAVHLVEAASAGPGGARYRLHDLVRLFAQERAAAEDGAEAHPYAIRRLVGACLALAERADLRLSADFLAARPRMPHPGLTPAEVDRLTADPGAWFDREHAFLLAVVEQGLTIGAVEPAGGLAVALTTFFQVRNQFDEWRRTHGRALDVAVGAGEHRTAMKLHRGLGELDTIQDRYADAVVHFETALRFGTTDDPEYEAALTAGLGYLYRLQGRYEQALERFGRARSLAGKTGNVNGLVYATNGLGVVHLELGRPAEAGEHFEECLRLSRKAGYLPGEAQSLRSLGHVRRARDRPDEAAEFFIRAGEISEALGDRLGEAHALCWLGEMRVRQGRHAEGRRLLARCLWVYREFGNAWGEAATLWALASAQLAVGRPGPARARASRAVTIWRRIGSPHWLRIGLGTLAEAYDQLGEPIAARAARREAAPQRERPPRPRRDAVRAGRTAGPEPRRRAR